MSNPKYVREAQITYKRTQIPTPRVFSSRDVAGILRGTIPDGPQEHFVVLAVDSRNTITATFTAGIGGLDNCPVDPASIFRFALLAGARALILGHNHPSGDPVPSTNDTEITKRLMDGAALLGLQILDHVIVTHDGYFSFLDSGLLPKGR